MASNQKRDEGSEAPRAELHLPLEDTEAFCRRVQFILVPEGRPRASSHFIIDPLKFTLVVMPEIFGAAFNEVADLVFRPPVVSIDCTLPTVNVDSDGNYGPPSARPFST